MRYICYRNFRKCCKRCFYYRQNNTRSVDYKNTLIMQQKGAKIVDVRSIQEYNEYHITGAINIPVFELKYKIGNYNISKSDTIIVYCQSGARSQKALLELIEMGYKNVYQLEGGLEGI